MIFLLCVLDFLFMYYTFHTHTHFLTHTHTRLCLRDAAPTTQKNLLRRRRWRRQRRWQQRSALCALLCPFGVLYVCVCVRVYGCSFNVRGVLSLSPRSLSPYYYYYMLVLFVLLRFTLSFGFYLIRLRLCLSLSHRRRRVHVFLFVILLRLYFCFLIYARASMRDRERIASLFYILYYVLSFARYVLSLNLRSLALSLFFYFLHCVLPPTRACLARVSAVSFLWNNFNHVSYATTRHQVRWGNTTTTTRQYSSCTRAREPKKSRTETSERAPFAVTYTARNYRFSVSYCGSKSSSTGPHRAPDRGVGRH